MELGKVCVPHVKYHIILENLKNYGYQDLDQGSEACYQLNGIRCDNRSTAVVAVKAYPHKYEMNFDKVLITQYIIK